MGIHGVDASALVSLSTMKFLYEQIKLADKVIGY